MCRQGEPMQNRLAQAKSIALNYTNLEAKLMFYFLQKYIESQCLLQYRLKIKLKKTFCFENGYFWVEINDGDVALRKRRKRKKKADKYDVGDSRSKPFLLKIKSVLN